MDEHKHITSAIITSALTAIIIIIIGVGVVSINRRQIGTYLLGSATPSQESPSTPLVDSAVETAVKKANPAVVSIIITKDVATIERYYNGSPFGIFGEFFGVPNGGNGGTQKLEVGGGSGFFVSADGLIVTNQHVVSDEDAEYTVYTNDGKKHTAKVIAKDTGLDIALIKIDGGGYPFLQFGNSHDVELGQSVIAIGNALGEFRNTVSVGVISGLSRSITAGSQLGETEDLDEVLQTDAAINPGNSGGPLLDLAGHVIGVNVAVAQGSQNVAFALPSDSVKAAVESVKSKGIISHPFIGVRYVIINNTVKTQKNLSVDYGVLVTRGGNGESAVVTGSPAAKAGIKENDIILEFDGTKLTDEKKLSTLIRNKKVGDTVTLTILRNGKEVTIPVVLEESATQL
jgi:serine protease Do